MAVRIIVVGFLWTSLSLLLLLAGGIANVSNERDPAGACLTHAIQVQYHYPQPQCP
jgi:hypothetical protein